MRLSAALIALSALTPAASSAALQPSVIAPAAVPATPPAGSSRYVPLTPQRIVKTYGSDAFGFSTIATNTLRVSVLDRAGVPAGAIAAVVNVTIVGVPMPCHVTIYEAGTARPGTSTVNADVQGRTIANLAHVKLSTAGQFDAYLTAGQPLLIDLVGVYVPVASAQSAGRFVGRPGGTIRALDTREAAYGVGRLAAGGDVRLDLAPYGVPAGASAAVVNVTAVDGAIGHWTAYPSGIAWPGTSTLNIDTAGQTRAGQAIVPLNANGTAINIFSYSGGHLVVDLIGWYTGAADAVGVDGLFVPSLPTRALDTRTFRNLPPWGGSTYEFAAGSPASCSDCVAAAVINFTATLPWYDGFITTYPAGQPRPWASTLNLSSWPQTIANHAIVGVSTRGVAMYTSGGVHLIADIVGYFLGTPLAAPNPTPPNPQYSPNQAVYVSSTDAPIGVEVRTGSNLDTIANLGYAAGYTNLTNVASQSNVMLFGHRTSGAAPFRYLDYLSIGERFVLNGSDGHRYTYMVVDRRVVKPDYTLINNIAKGWGPATAQLVACSKLDGTPTSVYYRIVVTGRLISVA